VIVSLSPQGADLQSQSERVIACVTGNTGLDDRTAQALREQLRRLRHQLQQSPQG